MKKKFLHSADFVKAANALTDESFHGNVHLDICEGLADLDPYIGNYAPVFFTYTFYSNLSSAQMHANKLFDTNPNAVTVSDFLEMAGARSTKFKFATDKEVIAEIAEAKATITKLMPTIRILRRRRNDFLAHLSPTLAFEREQVQRAAKLTLPQIREVLYEGGKIVNDFLQKWNNSRNQLRESHSDDFKKIISVASKQLCAEVHAHEAEFGKFGMTSRLPRPKDCP